MPVSWNYTDLSPEFSPKCPEHGIWEIKTTFWHLARQLQWDLMFHTNKQFNRSHNKFAGASWHQFLIYSLVIFHGIVYKRDQNLVKPEMPLAKKQNGGTSAISCLLTDRIFCFLLTLFMSLKIPHKVVSWLQMNLRHKLP